MTKVEKWLAGRPLVATLLAVLLGAAVGRGIVPADLALCLDAILAGPPEAVSSLSTL